MRKLGYKPNASNHIGVRMWIAEDGFGTLMLHQDSMSIRRFILRFTEEDGFDYKHNLIAGLPVDSFKDVIVIIEG